LRLLMIALQAGVDEHRFRSGDVAWIEDADGLRAACPARHRTAYVTLT
jgi:hypothetical protein